MTTLEEKIRFAFESEEEITTSPSIPELCSHLKELLNAESWSAAQAAHAKECRWCKALVPPAHVKVPAYLADGPTKKPSEMGRPQEAAFKSFRPGDLRDAARERALLLIETHIGPHDGTFDEQGFLHLKESFAWPQEPGHYYLRVRIEGYPCSPNISLIEFTGTPQPISFARNDAEAQQLAGKLLPAGSLTFERR